MNTNADRVKYFAYHDGLTGLYNRAGFESRVKEVLASNISPNKRYTILRWNIEDFKLINEMFGRVEGDRVLQFMPRLFQEMNIADVILGRLESDHFVAFYETAYYSVDKLEQFLTDVTDKFHLEHYVKIKIGVYNIENKETDVNHMIDCANIAAMTIKGSRTCHCAIFTEEMRQEMVHAEVISASLEAALEREEIEIYLQPVMDTRTKKILGAEVLSRWNHSEKGFLFPGSFIPCLEKNGLIMKLDRYVWEKACRILSDAKMSRHPEITLSVNMSRHILQEGGAVKTIKELLDRYHIAPSRFKVEITESTYMNCTTGIMETIQELRNIGIAILMDDFGTGFSSLEVLRKIPMDCLKIDISFVQNILTDIRSKIIVEHVIPMAKELGMTIIAEGVETKDQEKLLTAMGCEAVQGYLYEKPIPVYEFEEKYCK